MEGSLGKWVRLPQKEPQVCQPLQGVLPSESWPWGACRHPHPGPYLSRKAWKGMRMGKLAPRVYTASRMPAWRSCSAT